MDKEQYLNEVREALEKDTTSLGNVYQLVKKGKSLPEIAEELNVSNWQAYGYWTSVFAIEEKKQMTRYCAKALFNFLKRHYKDFSKETITELRIKRVIAAKYGIAGIYVYTYPHYYRHPVVKKGNRTYLKIGMSEKDVYKRVIKQQQTGMPERPMFLQIWVDENDGDLREIEKKIHDPLRRAGHVIPKRKRKEWFLTNAKVVSLIANHLGLSCIYDRRRLLDNRNPKTDD